VATSDAIAVVGEAIVARWRAGRLPEHHGARFELYQVRNFRRPMAEGLSLFLYHVHPAPEGRNTPPRASPGGAPRRPALLLDLHYLVTSWGRTASRQHRLLGWALRLLEDAPVLTAEELNRGSSAAAVFSTGESAMIRSDSLNLHDMASIWEAIGHRREISAAYRVTGVAVDAPGP